MADRSDAQKRRAEARDGRRTPHGDASDGSSADETAGGATTGGNDAPRVPAGLRDAARAATAAAAVGAALGAVKAITGHRGSHADDEKGAEPEHAPEATNGEVRETEPDDAEHAGRETPTDTEAPTDTETQPDTEASAAADGDDDSPSEARASRDDGERETNSSRAAGADPGAVDEVLAVARERLRALRGHDAESISSFERTQDGWVVRLEVVEVSRIPESTDVLASYEVELDDDQGLRSCRRVRRYYRAQADEGEYA
jgi:hypothetical protein